MMYPLANTNIPFPNEKVEITAKMIAKIKLTLPSLLSKYNETRIVKYRYIITNATMLQSVTYGIGTNISIIIGTKNNGSNRNLVSIL